jgi:hypothetical protein
LSTAVTAVEKRCSASPRISQGTGWFLYRKYGEFLRFQIREVFPGILYPGQINITKQVQIIFSANDLIQYIAMTFAKYKLTPDLGHIHIGIYKKR